MVRTGERFGAGPSRRHPHRRGERDHPPPRPRPPEDLRRRPRPLASAPGTTTVRQLFAAGALAEASAEHGGFRLTAARRGDPARPRADRAPRRQRRSAARGASARPAACRDAIRPLDGRGAALFEHLRALRLDIARREKIAAYMVFADRTLIEMARQPPGDRLGAPRNPRRRRGQARALRRGVSGRHRAFIKGRRCGAQN